MLYGGNSLGSLGRRRQCHNAYNLAATRKEIFGRDLSKACAAKVKRIDWPRHGYRIEPRQFSSVKLSKHKYADELTWLTEQAEAKFNAQVRLAKYLQC
jgi:hypothetical protein